MCWVIYSLRSTAKAVTHLGTNKQVTLSPLDFDHDVDLSSYNPIMTGQKLPERFNRYEQAFF